MWPFDKKHKNGNTLIAIRYTKSASKSLFPDVSDDVWESVNQPDDLACFIRESLRKGATHRKKIPEHILIATIDDKYLEWLRAENKQHSQKTLRKYIKQNIDNIDFWNNKLIDSKMTTAYNVLGIQNMLIPSHEHCQTSNYSLSRETSAEIAELLSDIYDHNPVFVPGWILKGRDSVSCVRDIIQLSKLFWSDGLRVRVGKFMEQQYDNDELSDKFTPVYCTIPFVVQSNVQRALIHLCENDMSCDASDEFAMSRISFSGIQRFSLFSLITKDVAQIISIGSNAISPEVAYFVHNKRLSAAANRKRTMSVY